MVKYLIKDTTREERERIVAESLGNIDASCDGCSSGIVEMYQEYIDGKKELREISMEFNARYISGEEATVSAFCMMSCKEILIWISMYICCEILLSQEKNTSDAVKRCWPMRQLQNTSL